MPFLQLQTWQQPLPIDALANVPVVLLQRLANNAHRDSFQRALAARAVTPTLISLTALPHILLAGYLAVPHSPRRLARWPVLAAIWALCAYQILCMSTANVSFAYCIGVGAMNMGLRAWHLLVGLDVHEEAMRVVRRKRGTPRACAGLADDRDDAGNGTAAAAAAAAVNGAARQRKPSEHGREVTKEHELNGSQDVDGFDRFRCSGWNIAISTLPKPDTTNIKSGDVVDMKSASLVSRSGCKRFLSPRAFIRNRVVKIVVVYLIVDIFGNAMSRDPLFVLGSELFPYYKGGLPFPLDVSPPLVRTLLRRSCAAVGVWGMLECYSASLELVVYFLLETFFPSKGGVWQFSTLFGSFEHVLDRGLPGAWGSFWHQSFRMSFLAPVAYLIKKGYLKKGSAATQMLAAFSAFLLSGLFHAAGSVSSTGLTQPWRPMVFFMLQFFGILLQKAVTSVAGKLFAAREPPSRSRTFMRRSFNLLFVTAWLWMTSDIFIDDLATAGVWLCEPLPFSFVKLLGFGPSGWAI
ncbi:hypothetical protein ESCO_004791 [Escovopsis weberi]|uniref:Wax synthase domain-containing protein n=1 Tax=Escovopsis weberi TaxID=150374 RepID=A0A0M8MRB1_ESCWE|nr:hypothetical protein ESCO_004791 [Escovopsis weberi]